MNRILALGLFGFLGGIPLCWPGWQLLRQSGHLSVKTLF